MFSRRALLQTVGAGLIGTALQHTTKPTTTAATKAGQYVTGQFLSTSSWARTELPASTPAHPSSSTLLAELIRQTKANPQGGAGFNAGDFGIGTVTVSPSDPVRTMHRTNDGATWQVRLPDSLPIPSGTDGSVVIWDPQADTVVEAWQAKRQGDGWACTWGGYYKGVSSWDGLYADSSGIAAAGTSFLSQMVTVDDMTRTGPIGHVIGIATAHNHGLCWPASRTDGHGGNPGCPIKMGQRFRLPADVDLTGLSPAAAKLAEAIRDYGLAVLDSTAQPGDTYPLWVQINAEKDDHGHFTKAMGADPGELVRTLPWDQLVALPDGYGKT